MRRRRSGVAPQLALAAAAFLFGSTFVVVKGALAEVRPVPFLAVRFLVGAAALAPLAVRSPSAPGLLRAGLACGGALLAGYLLQTVGLRYTDAPTSAFITYLLVAFVPLLSAIRSRRRPDPRVIMGVALAGVGLWLLTGARLLMGRGELLTLGCAMAFAVHVVLVADHAPRHAALRLNAVQLVVVGAACLVPGLWLGGYRFTWRAWLAAGSTGVAVSAAALSIQVWAQARMDSSHAALVLSLEPVFAALLGYVAGQRLGPLALAGGGLILLGVLLAELGPWPRDLPPEAPS